MIQGVKKYSQLQFGKDIGVGQGVKKSSLWKI